MWHLVNIIRLKSLTNWILFTKDHESDHEGISWY